MYPAWRLGKQRTVLSLFNGYSLDVAPSFSNCDCFYMLDLYVEIWHWPISEIYFWVVRQGEDFVEQDGQWEGPGAAPYNCTARPLLDHISSLYIYIIYSIEHIYVIISSLTQMSQTFHIEKKIFEFFYYINIVN